ncbi:SLAP domain-containing protein [Lactobacillus sp. ESL0701]|uniref:SLAP domain-containing protein n=1 Tax=Lactobacillus sp. ESL0701 TaxID=2983217 RepID=UPI0023F7CF40|nr:SLAP domain-containing protein [Lactobacillus sp. ESL0701]MDF7672544.1 SLAP domain-containing protein [Lactobacillus sp. ESL0701]
MKKNKKIIVSLAAAVLATTLAGSTIFNNQAHAAQTTDQTQDKTAANETLTLNHNTRIYNKKGQKLYSYQRTNGLLKKGTTIGYAKKVKAIDDPSTVRYSFHDDDWNWCYLPYKTIKGQEYYSIGHGGYIKAVNVDKINGDKLFVNQITAIVKDEFLKKPTVLNSDERTIKSNIKIGKKVIVNREINVSDLLKRSDGDASLYGIKSDTNSYVPSYEVKINIKHPLLPYSNCMKLLIVNSTNCYTSNGQKYVQIHDPNKEIIIANSTKEKFATTPLLEKGRQISADKEVYIYVPEEQKKEKFYEIHDNTRTSSNNISLFVKASDVKYMYGKKL